MKGQQSLLFLLALLLCTFQQAAGSGTSKTASSSSSRASLSEEEGSHRIRPSTKLKEGTGRARSFSFNTSRESVTTVILKTSRKARWIPGDEESPLCAYRVIEGGIGGPLCFRNMVSGFKCNKGNCRTMVSSGNLNANILMNGSVLLKWNKEESGANSSDVKAEDAAAASEGTLKPRGGRHRRRGYELSCWWNGSYTQFECAGVHLGSGCRDFLLSELHENIPYRLCLRSLDTATRAEQHRDCVEFTLPPSGMQDIVIAMTTVGGAICVMLVIICLLVAYITENIMSPSTTQHSYSYRTHSRH